MNKSKSEIVWVGGMGTRLGGPRMERLMQEGGYTSHRVEGVHSAAGKLEVSSPSHQQKELDAICQKTAERRVLVSHCSGALAVINMLKETTSGLSGLLIAPPLPNPIDVLTSAFVEKTMQKIHGAPHAYVDNLLPIKNEPPSFAAIPRDYYKEVSAASPNFYDTVKELVGEGVVKLAIPTRDWNKLAVTATANWLDPEKVLRLDARHDLSAPKEPNAQFENYLQALSFMENA